MNITIWIGTTYGLLAASIAALWLKPLRINDKCALPPWVCAFAAACLIGLYAGLVLWQGIIALAIFAVIAWAAKVCKPGLIKVALLIGAAWMTVALSVHKFTGFTNPPLVSNMQVSAGAPGFTHNLNFDTAAAGLILFAIFCTPARSRNEWREVFRQSPVIIGTPLVVLAFGLALGYVKVDPKFVAYTPVFFLCNLLFTCVTEEAFFRGFIQEQFTIGMKRWRHGPYVAMFLAAILFGIAHAKGGPLLIGLATLAGLGYGLAFLRSKRIEAAILTHFALNALHFVAFTYPRAL
jgi:uncharacterized protein